MFEQLREGRLQLILQVLSRREIILIINETGDAKKGNTTDYVKREYIGNLGKIENGIVAVTAYGLFEGMTFPLIFEVYKPKQRRFLRSRCTDGTATRYEWKKQVKSSSLMPSASCLVSLKSDNLLIKIPLAESRPAFQ